MNDAQGASDRPVLSRADLENYDPQGHGRRWLCPFCGDGKPRDSSHRSLSLDESTGLWKCFRCGAGGKLRDNWEQRAFVPHRDQVRQRAKRIFDLPPSRVPLTAPPVPKAPQEAEEPTTPGADETVIPPEQENILLELAATPGESYLANRGISLATAQNAGVLFAPHWSGRPAVVFRLFDSQGVEIASQGRFCDGRRNPPAITTGPKKLGLFSTQLPAAPGWWRALPCLILTEAPIDALSLAEANYPALAFCGTNGPDWIHLLCGLRPVMLAFDADEAGDRAAETLIPLLRRYGATCHRLRPEGAKDWNEMLLQMGPDNLGDWLAFNALKWM
jgi:hypothetical protein